MKIYQIDSSARKEGSTSRALAKKLLNKITLYFLNRAYEQMEAAGDLQNADDVAEHIED